MEIIEKVNRFVNGIVWGPVAIVLILGVGLFLTIRLKGVQFRNWGFMFRNTYVKAFRGGDRKGEGDITSFQAAMASVSAVVGSGNIAGVATAIVSGGPGALFWMLVAALVGMATKFAEIALGVRYREKMADGSYAGGPMYYLAKGLHAPWLGLVISVLIMFFSVIISAVVDTNTMTSALKKSFGVDPRISGIIFVVVTGLVIFGGIKRIGRVCELLAPLMSIAYLFCGLLVIVLNAGEVPGAIARIVECAFDPRAAFGGATGVTVLTVMRYGMARGIFSNEAGVGTAAITHSSATVEKPGEQAIWGPFEVFVDTFVVCMVTGLTIIISGLWNRGENGVALTMEAFRKLLPGSFGLYVVMAASILFGFSCLITYYNYMEKSASSLFGPGAKPVLKIIWLVFVMIGARTTLGLAWDLADTCNGLIIFPNLIGLVLLSGQVVRLRDDYYNEALPAYRRERRARRKG